jgi:hypothetical protein
MRRRLIKGDSWVHVFTEEAFGGRGWRLAPGECEKIAKIGSIIVGPAAFLQILGGKGQEIMKLPPLKLVVDFSQIIPKKKRVSMVRVAIASGYPLRR